MPASGSPPSSSPCARSRPWFRWPIASSRHVLHDGVLEARERPGRRARGRAPRSSPMIVSEFQNVWPRALRGSAASAARPTGSARPTRSDESAASRSPPRARSASVHASSAGWRTQDARRDVAPARVEAAVQAVARPRPAGARSRGCAAARPGCSGAGSSRLLSCGDARRDQRARAETDQVLEQLAALDAARARRSEGPAGRARRSRCAITAAS